MTGIYIHYVEGIKRKLTPCYTKCVLFLIIVEDPVMYTDNCSFLLFSCGEFCNNNSYNSYQPPYCHKAQYQTWKD